MFSLGPMEMAIVGIVAVLLFGKKLPDVMRSLGKSYSEFRKGLSDIQSTMHYSDYDADRYRSSNTTQPFDDYEEPSAPRFEPPPAEAPASESVPPGTSPASVPENPHEAK